MSSPSIPLIILSIESGIPIPDTRFSFVLPNVDAKKFSVPRTTINGSKQKYFAIAISFENEDNLSVIQDTENKLFSIEEYGVLCVLISSEASDYSITYNCKAIETFQLSSFTLNSEETYSVTYSKLKNKEVFGEEELYNDLITLVTHIRDKEDIFSQEAANALAATKNLTTICNVIVHDLDIPKQTKLLYLHAQSNLDRVTIVTKCLFDILRERNNISNTLPKRMNRNILDFVTKDSEDNNEEDDSSTTDDESPPTLREVSSIAEELMPKEFKQALAECRSRLKSLPNQSMEYHALKEYLTWLEKIPWGKKSYSTPDLKALKEYMNESHFGLDDVKQTIMEHMAIESICGTSKGHVLCFVGPPGTGKTSIANAIAKATNRKAIKIALGGLGDEAEIRGHRRTYVASRPGRVIAGIVSKETMDPMFILDEIDKLGHGKSDPSAALLELLDPEQNHEFIDRYLEVPVDLSNAMFVCTANDEDSIPAALKDRFEIIYFRNYEEDERKKILKDYIIPNAISDYNLSNLKISFDESSLLLASSVVGLREIKTTVKKLLRKAALEILSGAESVVIDEKSIKDNLKVNKNKHLQRKVGF
jgi:ATP-dependent Lon protease